MKAYAFWQFGDFEITIDLRQWLIGANVYDFGWNIFIGPIRIGGWR